MAAAIQASRYVFTLNNYNDENYEDYFSNFGIIKRVVFGFEVAPDTGTPHLQGYLEFIRSQRLAVCRRILPNARWERARGCCLTNYRYCTKNGRFGTVGDWTREVNARVPLAENRGVARRPLSGPMIIGGLLNRNTAAQIRVSKEYSEKFVYYDKISQFVEKITLQSTSFEKWIEYRLYPWQYEVSEIE